MKIKSEFHKRMISRWGIPRVLPTDSGTEFVNKTLQELTVKFRIGHTKTSKYYPQANPTEKYNRTIKRIIKACLKIIMQYGMTMLMISSSHLKLAKMHQLSIPLHF